VTSSPPLIELRLRRVWLAAIALAVPAFGVLAFLATADIVARNPNPGLDKLLTIAFIVGSLGGLIVVPGLAILVRHLRGVPNVRLDDEGIVWGRDRSRDLSIAWGDVDRIVTKKVKLGRVTDRAMIVRARPGRTPSRATTLYGRLLGLGNRWQYEAPLVISTFGADHSAEEILAFLATRLPANAFEGALPPDAYLRD
jgi:hypothetical protein